MEKAFAEIMPSVKVRYDLDGNQYDINLIKFHDKHGDHFDNIEDDVLNIIATVHR